ncbi:MAG: hypothetical protein IJW31_01780 [Lentisphaeria bacterium]|nr:hypothetical protein [Lentisphaeria bacterium]
MKPELLQEWDYNKNIQLGLSPENIKPNSNKRAWWKCANNHSWQMEVFHRTAGRKCPYCQNKRVWTGYNDLNTLFPQLAKEWNYKRNSDKNINDYVPGSAKKVWWKCQQCGHEWQTSIYSRTKRNSGCPECAKSKRGETRKNTNLQTKSTITNPLLLQEWSPLNQKSPQDYVNGSNEYVLWVCHICGHEWRAKIANRTIGGRGCPCCANKKIIPGKNDLATTHPDLAKEWHPKKNDNLTPQQVVAGSGKKVYWICPKGHEYKASILHRKHGTNCPICNSGRQTSFAEQAIFYYVKQIFPDAQNKVTGIISRRMELDIYIPSQKIAIEYDGEFWHNSDTRRREKIKFQECKRLGIQLHRIREEKISDKGEFADTAWHTDKLTNKDQLSMMIRLLLDKIDPRSNPLFRRNLAYMHSPIDIDVQRDEFKIRNYMQERPKESLADLFPNLIKEWNYEKNHNLSPKMFTPGSSQRVWWKCQQCGHEWQTTIGHRTKNQTGCVMCFRKNMKNNHPNAKEVFQYTKDGIFIKKWDSVSSAGRALKINASNIAMCANHKRKFAGNFRWEYQKQATSPNIQLTLDLDY